MMRLLRPIAIALAAASGGMTPALSADDRLHFDVRFAGVKAGEIEVAADLSDARYSLAGRLESTGIVRVLRRVRYDAKTQGKVQAGRFVPEVMSEFADSGRDQSSAEMLFHNGVPQVKTFRPAKDPEPHDVDPATQGGALDPLTAIYMGLRDVPQDKICELDLRTFDGKRAARLETGEARAKDEEVHCSGVYTRVAGYSEEELAERRSFPFTLTYSEGPNGLWQVRVLALQTIYGRAELVRR